ncbi:hypothetical protein ACGFIE_06920 [Micromonospora sp. NPDC049275]|uniref:hypothetical protein n=1 Tax=Micromonospora sp. NPDC049275 TaxID=3364268 RepID=UPI00371E6C5D
MTRRPSPSDLLVIDGQASVQFAGDRAMTFRVVSVSDQPTYQGWVWLTGYVVNRRGDATAKREIFVQLAGLRSAGASTSPPQGGRIPRPQAARGVERSRLLT